MKAKIRDQGILFKTIKYRESSLILRVFLKSQGLVSILAKGIRKKPENNLLNTLYTYDFTIYEPQETGLYLLSEFTLLKEYNIFSNLPTWTAAECAAELYTQIIIPLEENTAYYDLLQLYLDYLKKRGDNAILLWWRFLLRIFIKLGIAFPLDSCANCKKKNVQMAAWKKGTGKLICVSCLNEADSPKYYEILSSRASQILHLLPQIGDYLDKIHPDSQSVEQLNHLFSDHYANHFRKPLKLRSLEVLSQFYL
ncbi:MAG: DNA repair protein RecO [Candidatus Cloacimonadaceae bacterium]|nr:DNA repair protein RecO [Candidatus Cloacimonadota bacterium]MDY0112191.1 DNA repair protein RecO [Candidatus Syntrophosphaera sp.]